MRRLILQKPMMGLGLLALSALILLSGCEKAGTPQSVSVPRVLVNCTSANCMQASGTHTVWVFITSSGCTDPRFGFEVSGTANAICSVNAGCTAQVTTWSTKSNAVTGSMNSGIYSICGILDLNGDYAGEAGPGDAVSVRDNIYIDGTNPDQNLSSWTDQ